MDVAFLLARLEPFLTVQNVLVALFVGLLFWLYKWATTPLNRIKRLGDVGYHFPDNVSGKQRAQLIRRAQKLRQIGDIPPVYPNGWFCVAESYDVRPGKVRSVVAFGQQLALLRSEDGKVHLFDAYCPHLGANLAIGGRVVNDNCIQCPFHGWTFSAKDGKCVDIPYSTGRIPEQAKLDIWPVVERNKHIYAWFHCDGLPPQWEIPIIPEVENGEWEYKGRTEHELNSHIQETPENGADTAHLHYLHLSGINFGNDITKIKMEEKQPWSRHDWSCSWEPASAPNGHIGLLQLEHKMTIFGITVPFSYNKLEAQQLGPGLVYMIFDFGIFGKGTTIHHMTPEEPLFQRARFVMYATPRTPMLFAKIFHMSESGHFERDISIWSNKRYAKKPILCKEDASILKHRRWYNQFYTDNSPRLQPDGSVTNMENIRPAPIDW